MTVKNKAVRLGLIVGGILFAGLTLEQLILSPDEAPMIFKNLRSAGFLFLLVYFVYTYSRDGQVKYAERQDEAVESNR
jgi:threonine/homoserine/homoserine lactone efflux protein